jgi:DNA-binding beta-propeller fold protein YncE
MAAYPTYAVDAAPYCGCLYANGYIWVGSDAAGPGTLRKLDKTTGATLQTITLGGNAPRNMCLDASGNIWLSLYGSNAVCKVRMSDGAVLGTYSCGVNTGPIGICYHAATDTIWTANWLLNTVSKITASTGALINQYSSNGVNPNGITSLGAWVFVANYLSSSWVRIVASTGAWDVNQSAGINWNPSGIVSDGTYIWVAGYTSGEIQKRTTDLVIVGTQVVTFPSIALIGWLTVGSDGYIYAAGRGNTDQGNVWKIDQTSGLRVAAYFTGSLACEGPAFDGEYVWASNSNNSTVSKILAGGVPPANLTAVDPGAGPHISLTFDNPVGITGPTIGGPSDGLGVTGVTQISTTQIDLACAIRPDHPTGQADTHTLAPPIGEADNLGPPIPTGIGAIVI